MSQNADGRDPKYRFLSWSRVSWTRPSLARRPRRPRPRRPTSGRRASQRGSSDTTRRGQWSERATSETGESFPVGRPRIYGSYSTVRPVKKVDAAGSQRISNEFIGTGSVRRHPDASGTQRPGLESPLKTRQPLSAKGRAGQALVEEVVLGVLDSVSLDA